MIKIAARYFEEIERFVLVPNGFSIDGIGQVIGYYSSEKSPSVVIFCTEGLAVLSSIQNRSIRYAAIQKVISPTIKEEGGHAGVSVIVEGERFFLPIDGVNGQFYDCYSVHRFLRKAKFFTS